MNGVAPTYDELLDQDRRQARLIEELRAEVERLKTELEQGAIPKSGYAAVRLDCFFADGCVKSSSSSSSAFNSAKHSGGIQRHSVRRSFAMAARVCSRVSSHRPDTTAALSWNTASALSSVQ